MTTPAGSQAAPPPVYSHAQNFLQRKPLTVRVLFLPRRDRDDERYCHHGQDSERPVEVQGAPIRGEHLRQAARFAARCDPRGT
jgi:hypothetical protein